MFSKYNPKSIFFLYGGSTNIINRLQIDINNLNNPLATLTNRRNNYEAALNRVHLILQNKPPHLNVDQLTQNILQDLDHNFNIRNLVNHLIRPSPEDIINRLQLMINGLEHNINRINLQLYNNHNRLNRLNTFNQTPFAQGLPDEVVGKIMRQTQGGGASLSRTPSATGRQLLRSEYGQLMDIQGIISAHGGEVEESLCLIPDNIIIRPAAAIGTCATSYWMHDMVDYYINKNARKYINQFTEDYGDKSQAYYPGSLMPELFLTFKTTFPPDLPEDKRDLYGDTGIITGSFPCPEKNYSCIFRNITSEMKANDILLRDSSTERNDKRIYSDDELWGKEIILSDLLLHISEKIKEQDEQKKKGIETVKIPNTYILQVCRGTSDRQIITEIDELKKQQIHEGSTGETLDKIKSTSDVTGPFIHFKKNLVDLIKTLNDDTTSKDYLSKIYPSHISVKKNSSYLCNRYGPLKLKQNSEVKIKKPQKYKGKIVKVIGYNDKSEKYIAKVDSIDTLINPANFELINEQKICDDCEEPCNIFRWLILEFLEYLNSLTSIPSKYFAAFELLREGILPEIIYDMFQKAILKKYRGPSEFKLKF